MPSRNGTTTALKVNEGSGATKGKCHNCGKKGHFIADCWSKGGGKEAQTPKWFKSRNTDTAKQNEELDFTFNANDTALVLILTIGLLTLQPHVTLRATPHWNSDHCPPP